jgi:hypothetical protein
MVLEASVVVPGITPEDLRQSTIEFYLVDALGIEYKNIATRFGAEATAPSLSLSVES